MAKKQQQIVVRKVVRRPGVSPTVKALVGVTGGAATGGMVAVLGSTADWNPYATAAVCGIGGAIAVATISGPGWKGAGAGMTAAGVVQAVLWAGTQYLAKKDAERLAKKKADEEAAAGQLAEPTVKEASYLSPGRRAAALDDDDLRRAFADVRREMAPYDDGDDD